MTLGLPSPAPLPDPWTLLLEPASAGDRIGVQAAYARLLEAQPPVSRPVLLTALARALAALGLLHEARCALDRALALDSPYARVAARIALPDPQAAPTALPGDAADRLCDQAAAAVDGDPGTTREQVESALALVPCHAESLRWLRHLAAPTPAGRRALCPHARWGWLSPERWHRRVAAGVWLRDARAGSGLALLRARGVTSRVLGTDDDHEATPAGHPLTTAETALDLALSLDREGSPAGEAALRAWHCASSTDPVAQHDAAGALVALGVRNEDAAGTALLATQFLQATEPGVSLWWAYEARLLATIEEAGDAQRLATRLLREGIADPVAFVLCIEALRQSGAPRAARNLAIRCLRREALQATARVLLHDWNRCSLLVPQVSPRLVSRRHDVEAAGTAG